MRAHGATTGAACLWRLGLVALLGLASYAKVAAAAEVCPQLSVALSTIPATRGGSKIPAINAGKQLTVRVIVKNNGPTDLNNNLVVGIALPNYLIPTKTAVFPAIQNQTLRRPVSQTGRDLYWINLSLRTKKRYKCVRIGAAVG